MGDCQNYGPFLGPYYNTGPSLGDPKGDHNFDNPLYAVQHVLSILHLVFEEDLLLVMFINFPAALRQKTYSLLNMVQPTRIGRFLLQVTA